MRHGIIFRTGINFKACLTFVARFVVVSRENIEKVIRAFGKNAIKVKQAII